MMQARGATLVSAANCSRRFEAVGGQHACRLRGAEHGIPAAKGIFDSWFDPQETAAASLAVHMGHGTVCCRCATANRVLVVSAISL